MAQANEAYAAGDEARLQAILDEWESSPESVKGEDTGAELVRTIRKLAQAERSFLRLDREVRALRESDVWRLKGQVERAEAEGRDLLSELASQARQELTMAEDRLRKVESV
jgi:hypothetical protein